MATKEKIETATQRVEWLKSMSYLQEEGCVPEPVSDAFLPWWEDLTPDEQRAVLATEVDWEGFTEAEKDDVFRRVVEGESSEFWMDGVEPDDDWTRIEEFEHAAITPERLKDLAAEIREDELAARVRDYGAEDAATSEQRVRGGAEMPVTEYRTEFANMMQSIAEPPNFNEPWTEADKLRVVEETWDWAGVGDRDKEAILDRDIDFSRITRDELNQVYESIGSDEIDERPARRLFDEANYARAVAEADHTPFDVQRQGARDTTRNLIDSVMLDGWPRGGAVVDFGIDSQRHYESLYYPIRNEEIAPSVLDAAMGNGAKLTELARESASNPHMDVEFYTSWDVLLGREKSAPADRDTSSGSRKNEMASDYEKAIERAAESASSPLPDKGNSPER